jgi:hypothetical protein
MVSFSVLSGCTFVTISTIRDMMIERRPTNKMSHVLNPSLIPNDKSTEPKIAIDTNTDIVDTITSFINSGE